MDYMDVCEFHAMSYSIQLLFYVPNHFSEEVMFFHRMFFHDIVLMDDMHKVKHSLMHEMDHNMGLYIANDGVFLD